MYITVALSVSDGSLYEKSKHYERATTRGFNGEYPFSVFASDEKQTVCHNVSILRNPCSKASYSHLKQSCLLVNNIVYSAEFIINVNVLEYSQKLSIS